MKLGVDCVALQSTNADLTVFQMLDAARQKGFEGVHFSETSSFERLDDDYLEQVSDSARSKGLYVELGMGACNPHSNCRPEKERGRDVRGILLDMIRVARRMACPVVRTFVGWLVERGMLNPPWPEQIDKVVEILAEVAPAAQQAGIVICIENHMDITAGELKELIDRIGSPAVGVCLDTANSLMLCEDPIESASILAPYVHCTHIKDAVLIGDIKTPKWVTAGLGEGVVDLPTIVRLLKAQSPCKTLSIEDHGGVFELHRPRDNDHALTGLWRTNRSKLTGWLTHGNQQVADSQVVVLEEFFDSRAQQVISARLGGNLSTIKRILKEQ